ncbi:UDP-N-acetylmuramoyl-L-alanyl-D-glutamate--2,6-diaminopimelate ligase [Patescibacteria group bacterium]|nr:UDP-N-acetylmuramoyl-L-alanyl-D-glutamate--2,6-diaminopimelate ligase [Patescibacteria group bacterium]
MKSLIRKIFPKFLLNFLLERYHFLLAFFGAVFYNFPSKKMIVIGVTGTNGKSTTVNLISEILEQAGHKVASLSSIKFKIHNKEWQNTLKMTMPGRFKIQKFLRQAINADCKYAILEITSEGIKQHRHRFIDFDIAVFTNLTPEHIESHGSFEKYRSAKGKLFKAAKKIHILNLDDENINSFLQFPATQKIGYGLDSQKSKIKNNEIENTTTAPNFWRGIKIVVAQEIKQEKNCSSFIIDNLLFNIPLKGKFNVYNALAAICVGLSQGIDLQTIKKGLEKATGIPGRMEAVIEKPFQVIVDYAHTPDSLEKVYQTLSSQLNEKKQQLICVLGACGGGRDKWKRPEFGKIAARYCSQIILTNEDPYDENPSQILSEIKSGISFFPECQNANSPKNCFPIFNFHEIIDRRKAIAKAMKLAKPDDTIIVTGKGCEPWMCVANNKKIPWDDREIVQEEFKKLNL